MAMSSCENNNIDDPKNDNMSSIELHDSCGDEIRIIIVAIELLYCQGLICGDEFM